MYILEALSNWMLQIDQLVYSVETSGDQAWYEMRFAMLMYWDRYDRRISIHCVKCVMLL